MIYYHTVNTALVGATSTAGATMVVIAMAIITVVTAMVAITRTGISDHRTNVAGITANTGVTTMVAANTATIHKVVGTKRGD